MQRQAFLIFELNNAQFAITTSVVQQILWLPELIRIEETAPCITGVFSLNGEIIPVIDLNIRFGHGPQRYNLTDRMVVIENGEWVMRSAEIANQNLPNATDAVPNERYAPRFFGIIVNDVNDVIHISLDDMVNLELRMRNSELMEEKEIPLDKPKLTNQQIKFKTHFIEGEARIGEVIVMVLDHQAILDVASKTPDYLNTTEEIQNSPDARQYFCPAASPEERAVFHARAMNLIHAAVKEDQAGLTPMAVVGLSGEYFGVELESVREFSHMRALTPIPCCPKHIVGNINLRGNILTLVDIRGLLNMTIGELSESSKVMIAGSGDIVAGITVDNVHDVIYLNPADITSAPSAIKIVNDKYIKGAAYYGGRVMTILDLQQILNSEDLYVNDDA